MKKRANEIIGDFLPQLVEDQLDSESIDSIRILFADLVPMVFNNEDVTLQIQNDDNGLLESCSIMYNMIIDNKTFYTELVYIEYLENVEDNNLIVQEILNIFDKAILDVNTLNHLNKVDTEQTIEVDNKVKEIVVETLVDMYIEGEIDNIFEIYNIAFDNNYINRLRSPNFIKIIEYNDEIATDYFIYINRYMNTESIIKNDGLDIQIERKIGNNSFIILIDMIEGETGTSYSPHIANRKDIIDEVYDRIDNLVAQLDTIIQYTK